MVSIVSLVVFMVSFLVFGLVAVNLPAVLL
jgi:hypothetical protein